MYHASSIWGKRFWKEKRFIEYKTLPAADAIVEFTLPFGGMLLRVVSFPVQTTVSVEKQSDRCSIVFLRHTQCPWNMSSLKHLTVVCA